MADEKLVTIAEFDNYIEAELAKQLLEDNGIKAVATGENASNVMGSISAVEKPQVQVLQSQAQKAMEILEENERQREEENDDDDDENYGDDDDYDEEEDDYEYDFDEDEDEDY